MKWLIPGLLLGVALNFFILKPRSGAEFFADWYGSVRAIDRIEPRPGAAGKMRFPVVENGTLSVLGSSGATIQSFTFGDRLAAVSANGMYLVEYQKVGNEIEFFNAKGDRFWKMKSLEYPYLSPGGKIILLLNGDHSSVRIIDNSGSLTGAKQVSGRFCTTIAFADGSDASAIGFMDGSFTVLNGYGVIRYRGRVPAGNLVKGIALSANGRYVSVHYGSEARDCIDIVDLKKERVRTAEVPHRHPVRTAMLVTNEGRTAFLDRDFLIVYTPRGGEDFRLPIPRRREGFASISYDHGVYALSYTKQNGEGRLVVFRNDATVVFAKDFPTEAFLQNVMKDQLLFLRGSDNLYCYSFRGLDNR